MFWIGLNRNKGDPEAPEGNPPHCSQADVYRIGASHPGDIGGGGGVKDVHNGTIWSGQTSFNRIALFSYKKKLLKNKYTVGPDC